MEEEVIKSALEIAMEKAAKLPSLTAEELEAQKEKECKPIGEALCLKFFEGVIHGNNASSELEKYRGDRGRIVRRAYLSGLCRSMQLDDVRKARMAMEGISLLAEKEGVCLDEFKNDFEQILCEAEQSVQQASGIFEASAINKLHNRGIFGSAIRLNLAADRNWQLELARIAQLFEPRLEQLRQSLMQRMDA